MNQLKEIYIQLRDEIFDALDAYLLLINEIEKKLGTTVLLSRPEDVDLSHDQHGCLY